MKPYIYVLVATAIAVTSFGAHSFVEDPDFGAGSRPDILAIGDTAGNCRTAELIGGVLAASYQDAANGDSARGCCVWLTPTSKCAYTNRTYCVHKAQQAGIEYEFYDGTECKNVPKCRQ